MSLSNKGKSGLTLIELIAAMLLVSFILGAVWVVYGVGVNVFSGQLTRGGITAEVERALFTFESDLRQAVSVTAASATSLTLTADIDSDYLNETIQYTWGRASGNPLNRLITDGTTTITKPMVHSVSSLAFSYYDSSNNLLSGSFSASDVRLVVITMTVANGIENFTIRTAVRLRCI